MLKYSKYQGLGNDFIICLDSDIKNKDYSLIAKKVCNNNITGKTDGFISVKTNPLEMIFYNQDGSLGTMCGNGLRCFISFCYDNGLIDSLENQVLTKAGLYKTIITNTTNFTVKANMNKPNYSAKFLEINTSKDEFIDEVIIFKDKEYKLTSVFMGTHHTVIYVKNKGEINEELGHFMCHLPIFKDRTNVDFVIVKDDKTLSLKTYERGVGFTDACGTGACASFCVSRKKNLCQGKVRVYFEKGYLDITCDNDENIYMEGPAELIVKGIFDEEIIAN